MIVKLDSKRRLTVPSSLVSTAPGDQFEVKYDEDDHIITLRRISPKEDWLDVLKRCPVPMDDLPPRSRELPQKRRL